MKEGLTLSAVIKAKLELHLKLEDIEGALKDRGIVINQANAKRLVNLVRDMPISANAEFFEGVPTDRQILLMYGFSFPKEGERS